MLSFTPSLTVWRPRTRSVGLADSVPGLTVSPCPVVCLGQEDGEVKAVMMTHLSKGKGGLVAPWLRSLS